jgi:hypothetical protein
MKDKIQKLNETIELLRYADARQQAADIPADIPAIGDFDVSYDIHCAIEELIDQLEEVRDELMALAD